MSITRWRPRTIGVLTVAGLAASLLAAPTAQAAPTSAPLSAAPTGTTLALADAAANYSAKLATTLSEKLGSKTAGSYLDSTTGRLVVTITDSNAAAAVLAAGAVPRIVTRSAATLAAATTELDRGARIAGTTWGVDPITNQVLVTADSTVTGAKLARLKAVVAKLGGSARLESVGGTLRTTITGGDAIYVSGARCSLGFNVLRGGTAYVLTAGHCTNIGVDWTGTGGKRIGPRAGSSFPGNDYGLIQYTEPGWNRPGGVNLYNGQIRDINSARNAVVGETAGRSGSTTGFRTGQVTGVNTTVNYPQGAVTGMIRTTICAEGGDSGGSMFANNSALGMTSGGSGNCSSGGTTYFQPVTEALSVYGASVY